VVAERTDDEAGVFDFYTVRLAQELEAGQVVYVTVSASRSNQEERDGYDLNPDPLIDGEGDTIWLGKYDPTGLLSAGGADVVRGDFQRTIYVDGVATQVANRAIVLRFDHTNWNVEQSVFVYAPDDPRSEGDRVVVVQHSVISNAPLYNGIDVRNVEVTVIDNDTPGVQITEIDPVSGVNDGRTLVVEGNSVTQLQDAFLVQLSRAPQVGDVIVIRIDFGGRG